MMFCPKCGTKVPDGSKFCESCGNNMQQAQSGAQTGTQQTTQPRQAPQPAYQSPQQPQGYQAGPQPAPVYQNNISVGADPRDSVYSVGGWLLTYLVLCIPLVNIVMLLVWAFGSNANRNKKNWAVASLIVAVIGTIFSVIMYASIAAVVGGMFDQMGSGYF